MAQYLVDGLLTGILYSLFAVGFALVYNVSRVFHIAAAGIYVLAACLFHYLVMSAHFPLLLAGVLAVTAAMLVNWFCDLGVYRPLSQRGASTNTLLVVSIGLMTILVNLLAIIFKNAAKTIKHPFNHPVSWGSVSLTTGQQFQAVCGVTLLVLILALVRYTAIGVRFRAVSYDSTLYETLGKHPGRVRSFAFLAGGALIAASACLNVYEVPFSFDIGFNVLVSALAAMIIGGIGRIEASCLGGLALGLLEGCLRKIPFFASEEQWIGAITLGVLLLFLFLRPQGLAGFKPREV
jgi:branched-chain amino acid transport system permease protein